MVADFKRTDDWNAITKELDGLNAADFSGQSLSTVTFNDKSVPLVKDRPSILLYGLTEEDRFNGSAEALRSFLDKQDGLSLLQAVERFQRYLRIPTISSEGPKGSYAKCCAFLKELALEFSLPI